MMKLPTPFQRQFEEWRAHGVIELNRLQEVVLRFRLNQGWSNAEIARDLNLKTQSVRKLLELTLREGFLKEIS